MTIALDAVSFGYTPGRPVLSSVSFRLPEGITAVLGCNGAGKSTLLRLMLGVLPPDAGTVTMEGRDVRRWNPRERAARIAYVAQRSDVSSALTAGEVASLGRFALTPARESVRASMSLMDVLDRRDDPFATLSAGQQQRVQLARAIAQLDPDGREPSGSRVLLADEPCSAMDPAHVLLTRGVLRSLASRGVRSAVVLHDLSLAASLADHALVLTPTGGVLALGPAPETLTPSTLSSAFGVGFERVTGATGSALIAVPGTGPAAA